jgi:Zn-dependent metalloprotease
VLVILSSLNGSFSNLLRHHETAVAAARARFASRTAEYVLLNGALDLKGRILHKSATGLSHIRFEQLYGGIPVFEGRATAHVDRRGRVVVTNGLSNIAPRTAFIPFPRTAVLIAPHPNLV